MSNYYISRNALYHHGIKGQKWGIRRFQDKTGRLTAAGRRRVENRQKSDNEQTEEKKGLSDKQKRYIKIGVAATGTALVAYGGYKLYKSGKLDNLIRKGKKSLDGYGGVDDNLSNLFPKSKIPHDITKDYKGINPNHITKLKGVNHLMMTNDGHALSSVNCQACTFNYELKCRGFDTIAQLVDTRQYDNTTLMNKLYKNPVIKSAKVTNWSDLDRELLKQGTGARGNLLLETIGGKHSIAYEVFNNKVYLLDTQIEQAFSSNSGALDIFYKASKNGVQYVRTDNLELNDLNFIKKLAVSKHA